MADGSTQSAEPNVGTWTPDGDSTPRVTEDAVIAACATVFDPEIPVNIYELGLVYAIDLTDLEAGTEARIEMTLTAPGCPAAQELPVQVKTAVEGVPGITVAHVEVVWDPPWTPERMSEDARLALNMY